MRVTSLVVMGAGTTIFRVCPAVRVENPGQSRRLKLVNLWRHRSRPGRSPQGQAVLPELADAVRSQLPAGSA